MKRYIWQRPDWPKFSWKDKKLLSILGQCRRRQGQLLSQISSLDARNEKVAQSEILAEEAIKTSAVEGEILNRESVKSSVAKKLGLSDMGLTHSDRHIDGLIDVLYDAAHNHHKKLTAKRLYSWQAALFPTGYSGLKKIAVGQWRTFKESMQVISHREDQIVVHFEAPPSHLVPKEMARFFTWWQNSQGKMEGLIRAGIAHFWFVTIHPFEDGNGRIARALTDMALAQDEKLPVRYYSLSAQIMADRKQYYDVLENSQKSICDLTLWLSWFLGCYLRAVERSMKLLNIIFIKSIFWKIHSQVHMTEHQRKVVNCLLDAGPNGFEGGMKTAKYASIAKVSRATAYREMADLVEKGILKLNSRMGKGRNSSYDLVWPEENPSP